MAALLIRLSVAFVDETKVDPLDIAEDLMALYDQHKRADADDQLAEYDLGADFLEAEWEN